MKDTVLRIFLVNAIFLVFGYVGLSIMDEMAEDERDTYSARVDAYNMRAKEAASEMVLYQFLEIKKEYTRCTGAHAPFLTDNVLIIGSGPGSNADYYSGVVYVVTMDEAFAQPKGSIDVLGYCE